MAILASEGYQPEPVLGFDHEKAVQILGYFLQAEGKPIDKMKLVKLVYLADRMSLETRGKPLNFDEYYSMQHGPVVSSILNGMNGQLKHKAWGKISQAGDNRSISCVGEIDSDHLSRADIKILTSVWDEFGSMTAAQLRNWTHEHCAEYTEVKASRMPIDLDELLEAVGADEPDAQAKELRRLQRTLGKLARISGN